jgi:hypothetical protein
VMSMIGTTIEGLTRIGVGSKNVHWNLMLEFGPRFEFIGLEFTDEEEKWNVCFHHIIRSEISLQHISH